jgi:hypothetical protein
VWVGLGMSQSNGPESLIATLIVAGICVLFPLMGACNVPPEKAKKVLHGAGYTNIHIGGHAWFACSEDDTLSSEFTATGPSGDSVTGSVCCGWALKDCTIRSE